MAAADTTKEATKCLIDISHDEPELLARMFIWCYCGRYAVGIGAEAAPGAKLVDEVFRKGWQGAAEDVQEPNYTDLATQLHLKMLVLADYYGMPGLEAYCLRKLESALREDDKEFMGCLHGLDEAELPAEIVDKVIACLLRQSRHNYFSQQQKTEIREAG